MATQDNQQEEPVRSEEIMAAFRSREWEAEAERDRSHWIIAAVIVAAALALGWWALKHQKPGASREIVAPNPIATVEPEPAPEPVPLTTLRPDVTSPALPRPVGVIGVYECVQGGQKVLSDRPCGPGAVERVVDTRELNTFTESGPAPRVYSPTTPPPRVREASVASSSAPAGDGSKSAQPDNTRLCEQIQAEIDRINARMRQGYSSQEGERLRARWHQLKNAYYDAGCGRP